MIQIGDTIISLDIFEQSFLCDLGKCKGECCIEGDAGAPLEQEEYEEIKSILPEIWNELTPEAQNLIKLQGIGYYDYDGEMVTSIIKGKECVFTFVDEEGVCGCVIDRAFRQGRISVQKPISCHLYPIRLDKLKNYTAVNYHKWSVCKPAVKCGKKINLKIYQFLKGPLTRKFGEEWYKELCLVAELLEEEKKATKV